MERNPVIAAEAASDLKGDISKICASLIFFLPLSYALASILGIIFSKISNLEGNALANAMKSGNFYLVYTLILSSVPLLFCIFLLLLLLKRKVKISSLKPSVDRNKIVFYTAVGMISIPLCYLVSIITFSILKSLNLPLSHTTLPSGVANITMFFISTVIFAPIFEEIIFRILILERLRRYGDVFAIVASAVLFSLLHSSFEAFPYAFVSGLILGFVAVKTGSALCSMIIHAVNNLISCISLLIVDSQGNEFSGLFILGCFGAIVIAVISAFAFKNKNMRLFEFEYKGREIASARKIEILMSGFFPLTFYFISFIGAYITLILF